PALLQRPGRGVGAVVELVDDLLDAPTGLLRDRTLAAERVRHGAARHPRAARDLSDVHGPPRLALIDPATRCEVYGCDRVFTSGRWGRVRLACGVTSISYGFADTLRPAPATAAG